MAGKARGAIVDALVEKINGINGATPYIVDLNNNASNKLEFWDEVFDFPSVSVTAGNEFREYLPGGFKWGHLGITIRCYVQQEEPISELEKLLVDIERAIDDNNMLTYDIGKVTQEIRINSISTDEGLLAPYGVGELTLEVLYEVSP
jgi:hypothetical protein